MRKLLLDSSILISHYREMRDKASKGEVDAREWATRLIKDRGTNSIVSPVEIEVLAGVSDPHDLKLTEAFLSQFEVVDGGRIPPEDWVEAKRIAKRVVKLDREVPRKHRSRPRLQNPRTPHRHLGDCLIVAIANRMNYGVITDDRGMSKQAGRTA